MLKMPDEDTSGAPRSLARTRNCASGLFHQGGTITPNPNPSSKRAVSRKKV